MTVINTANKIYSGTSAASKVYVGTNLVWSALSEADVWANAVVAAGGTVSGTRKGIVNTLINGLKTDGIWAKLDRLWIFGAENTQSALIDLKGLDQAAEVSSPAFTVNGGYAGNGLSSYINTTFNAATQGVNYTLNSAHVAVWNGAIRSVLTTVQTGAYDGGTSITDLLLYTNTFGPTGFAFRLNGNGGTCTGSAQSNGFFIAQRTSSTANEGFLSGASVGTFLGASTAIPNYPFFVDGRNDSNTLAVPSSDRIAAVSYGGSFTSTQAANYYTRLNSYATAIGMS